MCAAAIGLSGCQSPDQKVEVLDPLPNPYYQSRTASATRKPRTLPRLTAGRTIDGAVIVIDPGHGGPDPGAWKHTRSKLPEKTIVLDISKKVADELERRGATVHMTRTRDVKPSLDARAAMAERTKADLFVSIHADSAPRTSAHGAGVHLFKYKPSMKSRAAAKYMIKAFQNAGISERGIFYNNFHVLREHTRPSMLIEVGFLTNSTDARNLSTSTYRSKVADAIVEGVTSFFKP
jgi:N-acetylmuramoyl-L-alanine amidase